MFVWTVGSGSLLPQQADFTIDIGAPAPPLVNIPNNNVDAPVPKSATRDKNLVPISIVKKIMKQIMPPNTKISDSAKEMVQQSITKYIGLVTKKANERCQSECRKIMKAEDLLWAMQSLGFYNYLEPLALYLHRYRHIEGDPYPNRVEPIPPIVRQGIVNNGPGLGLGPEYGPMPPAVENPRPASPAPPASDGPGSSMGPNTPMFDDMFWDEITGSLGVGSSEIDPANFAPTNLFLP